jgi:hypothetical protein
MFCLDFALIPNQVMSPNLKGLHYGCKLQIMGRIVLLVGFELAGSIHHYFLILLLTVNSCIKVRLDLQADKSPVVVKGPFFPRVVNPRYRIRGTNV